jgi:hypothetical protein
MIKYYLIFSLIIFSSIEAKNNTPVEAPSDFLSLCKATLAYKTQALPLCEEIHKKFFSQNKTNESLLN